jgi:non-ribosomal peptide synthetase component E (peptide arylation enzyme)
VLKDKRDSGKSTATAKVSFYELFIMPRHHDLWIPTDKQKKALYCTYDIVHKDEDGDYQVYGRVNDTRYRGELLNLPCIEGAAVSLVKIS